MLLQSEPVASTEICAWACISPMYIGCAGLYVQCYGPRLWSNDTGMSPEIASGTDLWHLEWSRYQD